MPTYTTETISTISTPLATQNTIATSTGSGYNTVNTVSISGTSSAPATESFTIAHSDCKFTIPASELQVITGDFFKLKISDVNIYGHDKPKVVEVKFDYYGTKDKVKAICSDEDDFDLRKGIYIAMSKFLYGNIYTTEGIEHKAYELSLTKENEKLVNKAIKAYYKKLKDEEEKKRKKEEEKALKKRRKEKNDAKKRRKKETANNYLKNLIKEALK